MGLTPWCRRLWPGLLRRRRARTREKLLRFLDEVFPGEGSAIAKEKLKLIILGVLLQHADHERIIVCARRRGIGDDRARQFLRGDVTSGFRREMLAGLLDGCGADPVGIDVALELFDELTREERTPGPSPAVSAAPAAEPGGSGLPGLKPDPSTATTVAELMALLVAYRLWTGKRSYRKMSAAIGHRYAHNTLSSFPRRPTLAKLDIFLAYVKGCGGDPADVEQWKRAWQRIALSDTSGPHEAQDDDLPILPD